jgi:hypothetical protein
MEALNLPSYTYQTREIDGSVQIFDILRKKYVVLTPEEWVRQHVINLLITHLSYPRSLISIEGGLSVNKLTKRFDILSYDRQGKPFLLVECKAPSVKVDQKTITQATVYNQKLRAPYIVISNGLKTFCFHIDYETKAYKQLPEIPLGNTL